MEAEYKIIGGDGAEYGPASLDELKNWIGDGRVAGNTQVWRSDLALWNPAARYAELQQALARLHASVAPTATALELRPAGFWPRLGGWFLDRMVLALLFSVICQWKHFDFPVAPTVINEETLRAFWEQTFAYANQAWPWLMLLTVCYDVIFVGSFGATPGKMIIGAKIIDVDGSSVGYTRALLRSLAARFTEMLLCVGYLWIIVRPDKRGLHDLLAGTRVVFRT